MLYDILENLQGAIISEESVNQRKYFLHHIILNLIDVFLNLCRAVDDILCELRDSVVIVWGDLFIC